MSLKRAFVPLTALAVRSVLRLLSLTYRIEVPTATREALDNLPRPAILVFWHEQIAASAFCLRRRLLADRTVTVMASHSNDGELVTRIARPWGVRVVRGSASRGGREGLRALYRDLTRERSTLVIVPDGPRGPPRRVKEGVVVLSQMAQSPMIPIAFGVDRMWRLRSWDRMWLPRPGARILALTGSQHSVTRELTDDQREAERQRLEQELEELRARARSLSG